MKHELEIKEAVTRLGVDGLKALKQHYTVESVYNWYFKVVDVPTVEGQGPCTYPECDSICFEVWDMFCNTIGSFPYLSNAIEYAIELNEELYNDT